MDPSLDDFINYDNNTEPLRTDFPDFGFSFPENDVPELFRTVPSYMPKTIQNFLDQDPIQEKNDIFFNFGDIQPSNTQYVETAKSQMSSLFDNYTPVEQTDASYSPNTQDENEPSLNAGSKKITKREKAKLKAKAKQDALNAMLETVDRKYIPDEFYNPDIDDETKKKMIQVIRNRVSAQTSRDKKKMQVQNMEEAQNKLENENNELRKQNEILAKKLKASEAQCKSLSEQLEAFKRAETPCLKRGATSDFGPSDTTGTPHEGVSEETTSLSNGSSPLLYRAGGARGNFFGFGVAFTTLMCFLMFMGSSMNPLEGRHITQLFANLNEYFRSNPEAAEMMEEKSAPAENATYSEFEFGIENEKYLEFPILQQIKPLVDRFDAHHKELYQKYEKNHVVVNLANSNFENKPSKITETKKTKFLGKSNITKNATNVSTLVINSGFEVQKNESNKPLDAMKFEEEVVDGNGMLQKEAAPLSLEKADFVQLFVPKSALGQLTGSQNINEQETLPALEEESEGSADKLLEVWCKIFAVREMSPTL